MKKIYLIDANSFIYRMFYGVPEMVTKKGEYVNAIFGIARFFLSQMKYENPDYLIFVKDAKGRNFRHDLDENYKATRDKMPDNLKTQMPIISDMVKKMGVPIIEIEGYEADDVIGTLADKYNGEIDIEVDVLTGDKDLYSLVSKNVCIYDTMKKKKFGIEDTVEKFGVTPDKIIDYLAIVGDKADNIPGIDGFGPKKAVTLLNKLGGIAKIYETLDEQNFDNLDEDVKKIYKGKSIEKLENSRENAFLSKKLATIELKVELPNFDLDLYKFTPEEYLTPEIKTLFRELEFNSLLGEESPELKKWDDLKLDVKIITNDDKLEKLFEKIIGQTQGTAPTKLHGDTEITSLEYYKSKISLN
ncbi:MAG: 5'-3' exonuclease H3TH domain-containing protein [Candidatus Gracilibacteria bacterium]|nr:5'-3' exonuclease H3TH domain-containing protein [Candidatus Gracilibacteria bacterium]